MPLTGELSDLSLAELIEFFCNQRKSGRLKVIYPFGAGYFFLKSGAVVHARCGDLRGIDAVFYALTQPNASFKFSAAFEAPEQTINQPWTSVVLEGLRRMDEGVAPLKPSWDRPEDNHEVAPSVVESVAEHSEAVVAAEPTVPREHNVDAKAFGTLLSSLDPNSFSRRRWNPAVVVAAVVLLIVGVGVPWGWYTHRKAVRLTPEVSAATVNATEQVPTATPEVLPSATPASESEAATSVDAAELAKRQREARAKERAKLQEQTAANGAANSPAPATNPAANVAKPQPTSANSSRKATVQVTYDENGRVTQASGGDATALRIARQKRFPPGKAGSATVTIPIN